MITIIRVDSSRSGILGVQIAHEIQQRADRPLLAIVPCILKGYSTPCSDNVHNVGLSVTAVDLVFGDVRP